MPRSIRIPAWLKRGLVPCWNAAHHYGWIASDYLRALGHGRIERCVVCGRRGLILYRRRVIPRRLEELWELSQPLAQALARKESCDCSHCGAKLRGRRLAQVVLGLYPVGDPPAPARSLADWVVREEARALRVAEINVIDGLHGLLGRLERFTGSDYQPGAAPGVVIQGVRSEDLTRLSYPDASLDLVLTSESLEHVPDLEAALREIRRVLAPGGRHLFTVPVLPGTARTYPRTIVRPDGTIEHRAPPIAHPGGDWGYPVFTEFGLDLPERLEQAGFAVEVFFGPTRVEDLAQVYACRVPE